MTFSAFTTTLLFAAMHNTNCHKTGLCYLNTETDRRILWMHKYRRVKEKSYIHSFVCISKTTMFYIADSNLHHAVQYQ